MDGRAGDSDGVADRSLRSGYSLARQFLSGGRSQGASKLFRMAADEHASAQFPRAQRVWANAFLQCWENIANQTPTIAAVAPQFLVTSLHLVLEHLSVFHHEPDSSQFFDVLQRVARDRDDIRIRARRHYAN